MSLKEPIGEYDQEVSLQSMPFKVDTDIVWFGSAPIAAPTSSYEFVRGVETKFREGVIKRLGIVFQQISGGGSVDLVTLTLRRPPDTPLSIGTPIATLTPSVIGTITTNYSILVESGYAYWIYDVPVVDQLALESYDMLELYLEMTMLDSCTINPFVEIQRRRV